MVNNKDKTKLNTLVATVVIESLIIRLLNKLRGILYTYMEPSNIEENEEILRILLNQESHMEEKINQLV